MARPKSAQSYFEKLEDEVKSNNSTISLVLGVLIIVVAAVLLFNYFSGRQSEVGPSTQTEQEQADVSPEELPGKYTVKEDDTLFLIAEKYYNDGFKYPEIASANNLANVNALEVGQVLEIPKLAEEVAVASPSPDASAEVESSPEADNGELGTGGADTTIWGPKIEGNKYTVVEGDWLSTIAARAYGDIMAYTKIAEANNIANPDLILPGQELKLPR